MSSIRATRLGFIYQDKFALLQYLTLLQGRKKVLEFYVDYPLPNSQKSIDIRLIQEVDGEVLETVYEVKTGQGFKTDKKYKGTSEIREAVFNIKEYCTGKTNILSAIVLSPELKGKVSDYWNFIQAIECSSAYQGAVVNSCERLAKLLNLEDLTDAKKLYKFFKNVQIHISDSYSDALNGDETNCSPMDNQIIAILREMNYVFKVDAFEYELPPSLLYHSLLQTMTHKVGTAENLTECLDNCITESFTRRRLIKRDPTMIFHTINSEMVEVFQKWKGQLPVMSSSINTTVSFLEGGNTV